MSNKLGDVEARIASVHDLESVVSAMRGIAAARSQEARRRLDGIRACAAMIGAAISDALLLEDAPPSYWPAGSAPEVQAVIVVCAEQGFVGTFNERMIEAAQRMPDSAQNVYFVVGGRGATIAEAHGLHMGWSGQMVAHADEVAPLANRITGALYDRLEDDLVSRVTVLHATPQSSATIDIVRKSLLPFDFARFPVSARRRPPLVTLAPRRLLAELAEEYVYTQLCEVLMLSFAAENEARMRAMIAARTNVHATLDHLTGDFRRLRQEEITAEIVELAAGSSSIGMVPRRRGASH